MDRLGRSTWARPMDDVTAEVDEREEYSNEFENSRGRVLLS